MSALFFALAFVAVALFVYMGRYTSRVRVEESRLIAAPPAAVQARVADLAQWQAWNPWLEHARDVPATVHGDTLAWDVPHVGSGSVSARRAGGPNALRQQLRFVRPFAFHGRSDWRFEPAPGGTRVTWRFQGRVAFMLRLFTATVRGATALDLRFGLDRLASSLEAGPPAYTLAYAGVQPQPARTCAQQPYRGPLDTLATALPSAIAGVRSQLAGAGLASTGTALVSYLKTQLKLRIVDCRVGVELAGATEVSAGLAVHELPAHDACVLHFDGPPEALELAWYQAMQRLRVEQRQPDTRLPPYARYLADPAPGRRGSVVLHLPIRG